MALIKGKSSIFAILMIFAANRLKWNRGIFDHTLQLYHPFLNQWAVNSTYSSLTGLNLFAEGYCIKKDGSTAKYGNCGEDSYTLSLKKGGPSLIAVADGVGGWVTHGGDSSGVSNGMMKMMKKLHQESAKIDNLNGLIKLAFKSLKETRKFSKGTTTICAALFDPSTGKLDISNLGDSQLVVFRDGKLILEVEPGTWAFNSPYQIGFGLYGEPQGEVDEMTIKKELVLRKGDVIVMGTDGLFDNVFVKDIQTIIQNKRAELSGLASENDISNWLSSVVRNLTQKAYTLGLDDNYFSPFSKEAIEAGKAPSNYSGG